MAVVAVALLVSLAACSGAKSMTGDELGVEVKAAVEREFERQNIGWDVGTVTCENVDEVIAGAIADCDVPVDNADADEDHDDGFPVRVTFQDDAGHFEWAQY
jgi:hypothetical protein